MKRPTIPFLVIRERRSFWVEDDRSAIAATTSALRDGCYESAVCYDESGGLWPIVAARPLEPVSVRQRLAPWSKIPVELEYGGRRRAQIAEIVALLAEVLDSGGDFRRHLEVDAEELLRSFGRALTPKELIASARLATGGEARRR